MKLEMLTADSAKRLLDKKIYFIGLSLSHIKDFAEVHPELLRGIVGVCSIYPLDRGSHHEIAFHGCCYTVESTSQLMNSGVSQPVLIIVSDFVKETYAYIQHELGNADRFHTVYWHPDASDRMELSYRKKWDKVPLKNMILFRSGHHVHVYGADFTDNARALFEYMLANGYNEKWELVWLVFHPDSPEFSAYRQIKNVRFIGIDDKASQEKSRRDSYFEAICRAKYIFSTEHVSFAKNTDDRQVRIQLWHGCGFKTRVSFSRCEYRYEFMTVISKFYADIHQRTFGLRKDQLVITGYPKDDLLYQMDRDDIRNRLSLPVASCYLLWAPTFRKTATEQLSRLDEALVSSETGLPVICSRAALRRLNELLHRKNAILAIKLHPIADTSIYKELDLSNIYLYTNAAIYDLGLQITQIMPLFDAFISDYSSAAISYLLLDRPMGFTLDDVDVYQKNRGFNFSPLHQYLPGVEIYDPDDFLSFIVEVCQGIDKTKAKRNGLRKIMHNFNDGKNCSRILTYFNIGKSHAVADEAPR